MNEFWSWVLTLIGVTGFFLVPRVWWGWWVNVANQVIWFAYTLATQQWGFLLGVMLYSVVFTGNALRATRNHREGLDAPAPRHRADPAPVTPRPVISLIRMFRDQGHAVSKPG